MMAAPGVGCGAWIERDGQVLLVRRLRPPEAGTWCLPGGKVDWQEPAAAATAREVTEELGVTIAVEGLIALVEIMEAGHHWVSPIYRARIVTGEPVNREPEKHAAIGWFALDALPQPLATPVKVAMAAWQGGRGVSRP